MPKEEFTGTYHKFKVLYSGIGINRRGIVFINKDRVYGLMGD